jgi:uncharacterized protein YbjT (DUF2867 family)
MTFIVHGASGAQGAPIVSALRAAGEQVVAAGRGGADRPAGVGAVVVDFADPASLAAAYRGSQGVFVHLPVAPHDQGVRFARAVVQAVQEARPARVVLSTSGQIVGDPTSPLQAPDDSAIAILMRGLDASGVSHAVVAPRLYLENLLLPVLAEGARAEGVLRYPFRADYPVSWSSHLDVAAVVVRLLTQPSSSGIVGVGHLPGLTGEELAAGFAAHLGRDVRFEALSPEAFGEAITPLFGQAGADLVAGHYRAFATQDANTIPEGSSAQRLLGLEPLAVRDWLERVGA